MDPCQDYSCSYYAVCSASTPTTPTCICQPCHGHQVQPICDVNGVTYQCRCEYELAVCKAQNYIPTRHLGGCKRKCTATYVSLDYFVYESLCLCLIKHSILFSHFKQLLDEVFVISRIIEVEVGVISRSRRLRLIILTETSIILDITKTESNNCFIIH